ncbi:branched-chain amino acid aminotransferase [Ancylobacter sp. MQZ15Z-1]|uniref:Probable branched-chain-amino-acid aminotransferase n=1 Tax=Ancylobacter mangrovi TaxID=2972472 RepID=A0A9X2P8I9_9HYPH|nr:branched-chain amino acid aminotransferase [Ancylobacter mangrovi]MCS0494232.1 branched-chain amino acid aminotransferase [Ancylobacter mangrovi]
MTHSWSRTWTYLDGAWHEGNVPIMGVRTHAAWLGTSVFDGARAFEGVTPDLDLHCERVNRSALAMGLKPMVSVAEWLTMTAEGLKRFPADAELYIRPMYWAEYPGARTVDADAESTRWCLSLYEAKMPEPSHGTSITLSPFRRPTIECAVTDAKAGALYPNNARALVECHKRGFDNAALCDMLGNVAELATANVFMVKDGVAFTPAANGTFLAGITRTRTIALMRQAGIEVVEGSLRWEDFRAADELFTTGNYSKVAPITRIEDRDLQPGPVYRKARELYWNYAHG